MTTQKQTSAVRRPHRRVPPNAAVGHAARGLRPESGSVDDAPAPRVWRADLDHQACSPLARVYGSAKIENRGMRRMVKRIEIVVGAAIGLGMTARAAADGGADFLLVLSAGRLRVMGAPSLAAMLPIRDSNSFTDAFARREILDRVAIPVFFGAAACDPRLTVEALLARIRDAGYQGVANFPTAIHQDGAFRAALERAGLGFGREAEMLRAAPRFGLATLGYAKTRAEVDALIAAGVERLCLNFGWNSGGSQGV